MYITNYAAILYIVCPELHVFFTKTIPECIATISVKILTQDGGQNWGWQKKLWINTEFFGMQQKNSDRCQ